MPRERHRLSTIPLGRARENLIDRAAGARAIRGGRAYDQAVGMAAAAFRLVSRRRANENSPPINRDNYGRLADP